MIKYGLRFLVFGQKILFFGFRSANIVCRFSFKYGHFSFFVFQKTRGPPLILIHFFYRYRLLSLYKFVLPIQTHSFILIQFTESSHNIHIHSLYLCINFSRAAMIFMHCIYESIFPSAYIIFIRQQPYYS